jgi:geranylgeranyl diphosphate synthase type II
MMNNSLDRKEWVDSSVQDLLNSWSVASLQGIEKLKESMTYSFSKGGKRFRPVVSMMIAESFAVHPQRVLPWALSVEMIHTYSLIHDDLPCMDNDDVRRGEPTNHKVFGETTALLAGDALLTESFGHLAKSYKKEPELGLRLVGLLSEAAGLFGMVGGQAADLAFQKEKASFNDLKVMQEMKTGALIRVSAEGAAWICGLVPEKVRACRQFGEALGLAFQLKDDLLDAIEKDELGSFPAVIGPEKTDSFLQETTEKAFQSLRTMGISEGPLKELVQFNLDRKT